MLHHYYFKIHPAILNASMQDVCSKRFVSDLVPSWSFQDIHCSRRKVISTQKILGKVQTIMEDRLP